MAPTMRFPVFSHSWSLGVEEQFYLLWPLARPWVVRRRRPLPTLGALIAASVTLAMTVASDSLPKHGYALTLRMRARSRGSALTPALVAPH